MTRLRGWDYYPLGDRCFKGPLRWAMRSPAWTPMPALHVPWLIPLRTTVAGVLRSSTYCQLIVRTEDGAPRAVLFSYLHSVTPDEINLRIQRLLWPDDPPTSAEVEELLWWCTAAAMSFGATWLEIEVVVPDSTCPTPQSLHLFGVAHEDGAYEKYLQAGMEPHRVAPYYAGDGAAIHRLASGHAAAERAGGVVERYDHAWASYAQRHWPDAAYASRASAVSRALGLAAPFLAIDRCLRLWSTGQRAYTTFCIPEVSQGPSPADLLLSGSSARLLKLLPVECETHPQDVPAVLAAVARDVLRRSPSCPFLHVGPVAPTDENLRHGLTEAGLQQSGGLAVVRRKVRSK